MKYRCSKKHMILVSLGCAYFSHNQSLYGAGFAIKQQSASSLGTALAIDGTNTSDASGIFANPALISFMQGQQVSVGLTMISPSASFSDGKRTSWLTNPTTGSQLDPAVNNDSSSASGFTKNAGLPVLYGVHSINEQLGLGWALTAPYGTHTDYGRDWIGRYHGTKTDLSVLNLDLMGSYKFSSNLSVGLGLSAQKGTGEIAGATSGWAVVAQADNTQAQTAYGADDGSDDIFAKFEGDSISYGFVFGVAYAPTAELFLGLGYRSKVSHDIEGDVSFSFEDSSNTTIVGTVEAVKSATGQFRDGSGKLKLELPEMITLSASYQVMPEMKVYFNTSQTNWSSLKELSIDYGTSSPILADLQWKDSLYVGMGADYKIDQNLIARFGLAVDQGAPPNDLRSPRSPDNNRTILGLGGRYKADGWSVDFGYSYASYDSPTLDLKNSNRGASGRGDLSGSYKVSSHTVMMQGNFMI